MSTKKIVAILALAFVAGAHAATPATQDAQPPHHPTDAAAAQPDAEKIEQQTKAMQEMHEKMMAAKTPEERAALMSEGMTAMQNGMAMMAQMRRGMGSGMPMGNHTGSNNRGGMDMSQDMPMGCTNLDQRMDMMNAMMQLMMDLQPPVKQ